MAVFHSPVAVDNAYYNMFTSYSHNPTAQVINMGDQKAAIFGYVHAGYTPMYFHYWVPMYYLQYQPQPCHDDSWILNAREQEHVAESNDYRRFMPCDYESLVLEAQEEDEGDDNDEDEIELSEEELREWDLLDGELMFYDASDDDNGLSEEIITKHLKIRDCRHDVDSSKICVVCQDCIFDESEKIATLDCGHDFHAGCIKSWLMLKNCCPFAKGWGSILKTHDIFFSVM